MFNNKNFYPTPRELVIKMCDSIKWDLIKYILEPSAGKGDIVDYVLSKNDAYHKRYLEIDCIEIDEDLQALLKGKGLKIIHNDFLKFKTYKQYDLIIMNPPFDNGELHLLKALEFNTNIVCLLNAETIRNPYSNARKDLVRKLEEYNASIEYIENAFKGAERKTAVEIALIKINKIDKEYESIILEDINLHKKEFTENIEQYSNPLMHADYILAKIDQYNFEINLGIKLINEYRTLTSFLKSDLKDSLHNDDILTLKIRDKNKLSINNFIREIRRKYWEGLFNEEKFVGKMTSNLRSEYLKKIDELKEYDFCLYNINQIIIDIGKYLNSSIEKRILELFDELSHTYSWLNEMSKNILHYNGWKTNTAYKINKKVIIPLNGFADPRWYNGKVNLKYDVERKLLDITKIFDYLDFGRTIDCDISAALQAAQEKNVHVKIPLKYFNVTFYKKGTCHIEFTNLEILDKFNIFGSQRKGWLPPSYGAYQYEEMSKEEQQIINEFQGKEKYQEVIADKKNYIVSLNQFYLSDYSSSEK